MGVNEEGSEETVADMDVHDEGSDKKESKTRKKLNPTTLERQK
jgi:hypothetical protein